MANHLFAKSPEISASKPFDGDIFNRQKLAEQLTGYIERLKAGCVIGIDAPWGEGKSWFGRNWQAFLDISPNGSADKFRTIYLDAFQNDYIEDPFILICSEFSEISTSKEESERKAILDKGKDVAKALLPMAAKVGMNALGKVVLGTADISDKFVDKFADALGETSSKYIEKQLESRKSEKEALNRFKAELKNFTQKQNKPVVVFVDELDRCKPTFAVHMIERIKHFFDVPNLVFVLLLNRQQLEQAIKRVYGAEINADAYLGKFVQLFLRLPKLKDLDDQYDSNSNLVFCYELTRRYDCSSKNMHRNFVQTFSLFANALDLSLRDLEHGFILYNLIAGTDAFYIPCAWLIALKIKCPDIFRRVVENEPEGHRQALNKLNSYRFPSPFTDERTLIETLHVHGARTSKPDPKILSQFSWMRKADERLMSAFAQQIDFPVSVSS